MLGRTQILNQFHFNEIWDIIPNREGLWRLCNNPIIYNRLSQIHREVELLRHLDADYKVVVVSGDCMTALAVNHGKPVVWFDAHGDYHTCASTRSGSIGGMPLAMLVGKGDQTLNLSGPLRRDKVVHIGGSEFDSGERESMVGDGIRVVESLNQEEIDLCQSWQQKFGDIHLHIDTDVISLEDMPSSKHPAYNGMSLSRFFSEVDKVLPYTRTLSIKSCDPTKDIAGIGSDIILQLIRRFHGHHVHTAAVL